MSIKIKNGNGEWVIDQKAIQTSIIDLEGNFESDNVEGALRELAEDVKSGVGAEELRGRVEVLEEDVAYLKEHGGGGGTGGVLPTITSSYEGGAIEKGSSLTIPIFYTSPNMGEGTAYILVNNIMIFSETVQQGNNNIKIESTYLEGQVENEVSIYVKDRAGLVSNQLTWTVVVGGIELSTSFDYDVDYGIANVINMPYTITTGVNDSIFLHLTIDGNTYDIPSVNGYNTYRLSDVVNGLGVHPVSMYATVGSYMSNTISFNLVIVSTKELYITSTFVNGSSHEYGVPVNVNYRLSKLTSEVYNIALMIDSVVVKTQTKPVGNYYWTLDNLTLGSHVLTIRATSQDGTEDVSLSLNITIEKGSYTPVSDYSVDLLCDLNAVGKDNDDTTGDIWVDDSGNGHNGQLINFNFANNGFINNELVCDGNAYVMIPWSPWSNNAINGSTIDIIYTPINSGLEEARVIDYTQIIDEQSTQLVQPFKGVFADITQCIVSSASSGTSAGKVSLDDNSGEIHLTWVLDRENKFMKTYVNGTLSRIMYLTDSGSGVNKFYEDFSHNNYIYLNSNKGKDCGTINIKRFRVYGHALSSNEVLQNHLANIKDLETQEQQYKFNYENSTLPVMKLWGDTTNMTDKQSVNMQIQYISPNEEKYGASFFTNIPNNPVRIQGTSSLQYVRKNYTIYLKDEYGADMYYNPYGEGSMPERVFCLKADYVESSHANNTGMARFINDCVYDTKLPTQLEDNNHRSTINGFPILLYLNDECLGVYNFNHDRYSTESLGYNYNKFPNMLVYEINANSDTSAGAFYRYGDNAESSANVSELEYYKRDFNLIYGNRTTDTDSYSEIKTLVEWVSVAEQDLFRETIGDHFNKEYLFRYFLTVLMIGAVDSLGKNMKLFTVDGKVWYPTFYDIDTCLGLDNSGYMLIQPDVEIESGSYNTSNSNLWNKVWNYFRQELQQEWAKMRQGAFTLENLMKYVYDDQIAKIPQRYYNDDAQVKYLDFGSLYTYCCHGSKEHQMKRWLRERIAYVDSMMGYFTSQEDQVTIRMNKTGTVSFDVTTYIPLYFSVKWSNATNGTQTIKIGRGETKTFTYNSTTATDQEILIYHAQYIKRLDNLSNLNPSSCILANATKLNNVEIHSTELYNINVTNNKYLRRVDLSGCSTLGTVTATGSSLDLSQCRYLNYANLYGTALTSVELGSQGGNLQEIYYPTTIQSVSVVNQTLLETLGLPYGINGEEIPQSLYTVNLESCPNIKYFNTSSNSAIATSFNSMKYCNNLILKNSLDNIATMNYKGFDNLQTVSFTNMSKLVNLGFDDMATIGTTGKLRYIEASGCNNLTEVTFNSTQPTVKGSIFAEGCILNLSENKATTRIGGNGYIEGLETIILPLNLETIDFQTTNTSHTSIVNLWNSMICSINKNSVIPTVTHITNGFKGIDFTDMNIKNINMYSLVNIPKAINFNIAPTTTNPNFNTNRDGTTYPFLIIEGTIDFTNYTAEYDYLFRGIDFNNIALITPSTNISQTSFNYCFSNTSNISTILNDFLSKVNIVSGQHMFDNSDITDEYLQMVLDNVDNLDGDIRYCFNGCRNISSPTLTIKPVIIVEGLFKSSNIEDISNITINNPRIPSLFEGCLNLTQDFAIPSNTIDCAKTFYGCTNITHIISNWNGSLASNTENCYGGCYNIRYIDDKEYMLGYHFIPASWGGVGLQYNSANIFKLVVPNNDYSVSLRFYTKAQGDMYIIREDDPSAIKKLSFSSSTTSMVATLNEGTHYLISTNVIGGSTYYMEEKLCAIVKEVLHLSNATTFTDIITEGYRYAEKINFTDCKINGVDLLSSFTLLKEVNFTNVDYTTNSLSGCCYGCSSLTTVVGIDPTKCNNFESAFENCISLREDIALTSNVTNTYKMYYGCSTLKSIHSNWLVCTKAYSGYCYGGCSAIALIDGEAGDLTQVPSSWGGSLMKQQDYDILTISLDLTNTTITVGTEYTYRYTDWGDGTIDGNNSHTYAEAGVYTIKTGWNVFCNREEPTKTTNYTIKQYAIAINQVSSTKYTSFYNMFAWYWKVTAIDLSNYSSGFISPLILLSGSDMPNGCSYMFYQTRELKTIIGLENIDFKDNNMNCSYMFTGSGIEEFTFTDNFVTFSDSTTNKYAYYNGYINLSYMLQGTNITSIDFTPFKKVDKLGNYLVGICKSCAYLTQVNLEGIRVPYYNSTVYLTEAFYGTALETIEIPEFDIYEVGTTVNLYMSSTFRGCSKLRNVIFNTNINSINSFYYAFYGCSSLTEITNLESMTFDNCDMRYGFYNCSKLTTITLKQLLKVSYLSYLCYGCTSLTNFNILEDSTCYYSSSTTSFLCDYAFYNCSAIESVDLSKISMLNTNVSYSSTFYKCSSLNQIVMPNYQAGTYVSYSTTFQYSGLTFIPDIWSDENITKVYNEKVFWYCNNLTRAEYDIYKIYAKCRMIDALFDGTNLTYVSGYAYPETRCTTMTQTITGYNGSMQFPNSPLKEIGLIDFTNFYKQGSLPTSMPTTLTTASFVPNSIGINQAQEDITAIVGIINLMTNLSKASLLSLLDALIDITDLETPFSFPLSDTHKAKLTDEEMAVATLKGWTI